MPRFRLAYLILVAAGVFAMSALTFVDVIGRYFFNAPIPGSFEIVGLILGISVIGAFPLVTLSESHITVDLFDRMFVGRARIVRAFVVRLGTAAMMAFMAERLFVAALDEMNADFVTENLGISRGPLLIAMSAILFVTALGMICVLVHRFRNPRRQGGERRLMLTALIGFAGLLAIAFLGFPLGLSMLLAGFIGVGVLRGWTPALETVSQQIIDVALNTNFAVLPMFLLMGAFVYRRRCRTTSMIAPMPGSAISRAGSRSRPSRRAAGSRPSPARRRRPPPPWPRSLCRRCAASTTPTASRRGRSRRAGPWASSSRPARR